MSCDDLCELAESHWYYNSAIMQCPWDTLDLNKFQSGLIVNISLSYFPRVQVESGLLCSEDSTTYQAGWLDFSKTLSIWALIVDFLSVLLLRIELSIFNQWFETSARPGIWTLIQDLSGKKQGTKKYMQLELEKVEIWIVKSEFGWAAPPQWG